MLKYVSKTQTVVASGKCIGEKRGKRSKRERQGR